MTVSAAELPSGVAQLAASEGSSPRRPNRRRREGLVGLLAVTPALLFVLGVMLYPIGYAIFVSFYDTNGISFSFVGFDNYVAQVVSPLLHQVFFTNLVFLLAVPLVIVAALVCSVLLYERIRGWRAYRVIFFIPNVLSTAVVGLMFKTMFSYDGPVNAALTSIGFPRTDFFATTGSAIAVIVLALVWSGFGYQTLILLSGLSAINPEIFEAAALDGAGWWSRLWHVTMPNIRRSIALVCILNVLYTFTSLFGFIFVMTAGGPGYDTTTLDYLIYLEAFPSDGNIGPGSALAILTFLFITLLTIIQLRFFRVGSAED